MSESKELHEKASALHQDLLVGRLTASAQIAEFLHPLITKALSKEFSNVDDKHLIHTATNDALLYYLKSPSKFNSNRGSLIGYIYLVAKSRLLNLLKAKDNTSHPKDFVELDEERTVYSNEIEDNETIEQTLINAEQDHQFYQLLSDLLPNSVDQEILKLMMDGERETEVFAAVLGISGALPEEQRTVVKQHKDRIKKIVKRHRSMIIK